MNISIHDRYSHVSFFILSGARLDCKIYLTVSVVYRVIARGIPRILLPKLVPSDQTGFMKGRYIGENIRLIYDQVMEYTMVEKKGGILVSLDFKTAFDSLEWQILSANICVQIKPVFQIKKIGQVPLLSTIIAWFTNLNVTCATQIMSGTPPDIYTINEHKYSGNGRHLEQHGLLKTDLNWLTSNFLF